MFSRLRPLHFDRKSSTPVAKPQKPKKQEFLPEEKQLRQTLDPHGLGKGLGFASDLKKLESAPDVQQERERLRQEAEVPATELRPVANRRTGQQGLKIEDVARILQGVSNKRGSLEQALQKVPEEYHDEVKLAHVMVNMMDEATYQLSKGAESGAGWYDQDIDHLESGLVHLINHSPAFQKVRGTFGKLDPKTGRADANNPRVILFKAVMTPLSFGQNPVMNTTSADRVLQGAVANTPEGQSPFLHLPPRNPETGGNWTYRGKIVPGMFKRIERLVNKFGEAGAAKWLLEEHTPAEIEEFNPSAVFPHGRKKTYPGAYILGPKGGAFFLNLNRRKEEVTKDMWFSRTWNRILGSLISRSGEIVDAPRPAERRLMDHAASKVAKALGLTNEELQATLWYYEQSLWKAVGATVESYSYKHGIHEALRRHQLQPPQLRNTGTPDEERREAAYSGAARRSLTRHSKKAQGKTALRLSRRFLLRYAAVAAPQAQPAAAPMPAPMQMPAQPAAPQKNPAEEHREHLLAFSPNVDDLAFEDALARSRSGNHKAFKQIIKHINEQVGLKTHLEDAIGDWQDGAENSILQRIDVPVDSQTIDYLAAWYGLLANQKAVLAFTPTHNGLDSVYQIELPTTDLAAVRKSLDKAGLAFRTLVPSKKGTKVVLFDKNRENRDKVAAWAGEHNATVRESYGQGREIGGSTRTGARSAYRKIITAYESSAAKSGGKVPTYKPPVLPHHVRSGDEQPKIKESRQGRVVRFGLEFGKVDPLHDTSIPRDKYDPKAEVHRLAGVLKDIWHNLKETAKDAYKQAGKPRRRRRFAAGGIHAPAGGVVVRGIFYPGGKWIPSANLEKASYDQYQHVEAQRAKRQYRREDGSVCVEPALHSEGAKTCPNS